MNAQPEHDNGRPDDSQQWAPWWVYLLVILGANYLRAGLVDGGSMPLPVTVGIAVGQAAILFVVITAVWRATRSRR